MRSHPGGERPARVTLVLDVAAVGGAEIVLRNTFAHLDPARVVTDVVCLREPGPLAGEFRRIGAEVTTLERRGRYDLSTLPRLVRHLRRRGTDVVVVSHHHRAALTLGRVAALFAGARSVVAAHDMDLTRVGGRVLPRYVVATLFLSRGLALLAPSQGDYLREQEGVGRGVLSRVREFVVPNGIPMPPPGDRRRERNAVRTELGIDDDEVVVAVVARLSAQKAHHVLIEAVARAGAARLRVLLVGDGPRQAEIEALVAGRGLAGRISLLGLRRDVGRLLAAADVFALSSVHEGVPLSVIEAMAHGLPIVATDCGALRDLVTDGEHGYLVPVGDADALADRLRRLAADAGLRAELGRRAEERARREFAIEDTAAAFTGMVGAVLGRELTGPVVTVRRMPGLTGNALARLTWYVQRLRAMAPREVVDRAVTAGATAVRRVLGDTEPDDAALLGDPAPDWAALLERFRAGTDRPVLLDRDAARAVVTDHPEEATALLAAAERAADHAFTFFAQPEARYDGPIDWSYDPLTQVRWPDLPSHAINHRAGPGNPKWIWELNRLQHLPWLAQAWLVTGEDRYATEALDQLDAWVAANPPGRGIAWRGAFEVGIRAISVLVALQGLRDHPGLTPQRYRRVVRMLAAGARRCWRDRSRHSSANNHLVGELAGLAMVAIMLPDLAPSPSWERDAVAALAVEADRQILPDGVGAEQAVGYQIFAAELLAVVVLLLHLRDGHAPSALVAALDRSAVHLADLVGEHDPAPRTGDDDEGFALRLGPAPTRAVRAHLALVAALTGNPAARRYGEPDLTAAWFARGGAKAATDVPADAGARSVYAEHGGVVVLRSAARRVLVDVGPLGYLGIAAHGHADALAVSLAVDGHELVGDPGTASYFTHPTWRAAHRSTRAHATVAVDDLNQSVMGGAFLWTHHAAVRVLHVDPGAGVVAAEQDGYTRLSEPVVHRRWVVAPPTSALGHAVLVVDLLIGDAGTPRRVRTAWPLHPDLDVSPAGSGFRVVRTGQPVLDVAQAASAAATPWSLRGDRVADPADAGDELGWWSERLEARRPSWLVGLRLDDVALPVAVATVLGSGAEPSLALTTDVLTVTWHDAEATRRVDVREPFGRGAVDATPATAGG